MFVFLASPKSKNDVLYHHHDFSTYKSKDVRVAKMGILKNTNIVFSISKFSFFAMITSLILHVTAVMMRV
jgi:hypothetical protein